MATVKRKKPLTEAEAGQLADYVERMDSADLSRGRPGPGYPGRPSLTAKATHSPSIHVRLPEQLYDTLSKRADAAGKTVSTVVREILEKDVQR